MHQQMMNEIQKERDNLIASMDSIVLNREECDNLNEQFFLEKLKELAISLITKLHQSKQPLDDIIVSQRHCFPGLSKQSPGPFLSFQPAVVALTG